MSAQSESEQRLVELALQAARQVADPELPFLAVGELGIVREVVLDNRTIVARVSPTYTGCPAVSVIEEHIEQAIKDVLLNADTGGQGGNYSVRVERQLAPAWTTDWITDRGRQTLAENGIAPPAPAGEGSAFQSAVPIPALFEKRDVACPHCASADTECLSEFGSTPCKAQYRCKHCGEPFDHFKCLR